MFVKYNNKMINVAIIILIIVILLIIIAAFTSNITTVNCLLTIINSLTILLIFGFIIYISL